MKKRLFFIFLIVFFGTLILGANVTTVKADELSDAVHDQLDNLDLNDVEEYFDSLDNTDFDFFSTFKKLLNGEYDSEGSVFDYIKRILFSDVKRLLPLFAGVIVVALLCEILRNAKSAYLAGNVGTVIRFVSILSVILILSAEFVYLWNLTQNVIENIGKFSEIISPIILTLMIASGGSISAAMYKPSVVFFTNAIITAFYSLVLPIIGVYTVFNVLSHCSKEVKLKKFSDFFGGILKWMFGILVVVYGFFITVQGISVSTTDGISAKVAKYAISNSVPIVGGLIKDGLDVIAAGSVVIKNALGIAGVIGVFYFILSPVILMAVFSLLLKLAAAIIDVYSDGTVSDFLLTLSKSVAYFVASVLTVGLMAFLSVLLMIFSANSVLV